MLVLGVSDAAACQAELQQQRDPLERGFRASLGLQTACLALLPARGGAPGALLFECTFAGELVALASTLFTHLGAALNSLFLQCAGAPAPSSAHELAAFLRSEARRACSLGEEGHAAPLIPRGWPSALFDAIRLVGLGASAELPLTAAELEAQRSAVGLQEWQLGVPLLHAAWLSPEPSARAHLKRALRSTEHAVAPRARFLLVGQRLLFLAYPSERALLWSERASHAACFTLARIWANTRGFPGLGRLRRARRERRVQDYLLDYRVPVAVWFNAAASSPGA